jgi:hypothetical protein
MNWLIWRQHRKQLGFFGIILLIFAAVTIPGSIHFWHSYQHVLATCGQTDTCDQIRNTVFHSATEGMVVNSVKLSLLGLPFILGLFWGAPLIAKEYVDNTNKLVWTQGVSRRKWLTAKLAWTLLATALYAGVFAVLATWFSRTGNAINGDRFEPLAFSSQALVPVAATIFAVAVGVALGAWLKKILPALGATLVLLLVLQVTIPLTARPHYQPAQVSTVALDQLGKREFRPLGPSGKEWVIDTKLITDRGQVLDTNSPPRQCVIKPGGDKAKGGAFSTGNGPIIGLACITSLGYHWEVKYQPTYRYWNFQWVETALYLSLAGVAIAATYWLVLKRDA